MIPYVAGDSEDMKHISGRFGVNVVYRSGQTLCSLLTTVNEGHTATREVF